MLLPDKETLFKIIFFSFVFGVFLYLFFNSSFLYNFLLDLPRVGKISKSHYEFILKQTLVSLESEPINVFSIIDLSDEGFSKYLEFMADLSKDINITIFDHLCFWFKFMDHSWFGGLSYKSFFLFFGPFLFTFFMYLFFFFWLLLKIAFFLDNWFVLNERKIHAFRTKYRIHLIFIKWFLFVFFTSPIGFIIFMVFGYFVTFFYIFLILFILWIIEFKF